MALRDELLELSDRAWQRLADRVAGLTDDEYLWEPVPGCWTVRPDPADPAGAWTADFRWPPPDPPPVTTIGWRLAHLVTDDRFRVWLGLPAVAGRPTPTVPRSAADAVEAVATTAAQRRSDLLEMTDADLWQPIGPVGGPYGDGTRVSWVLHTLDEAIHHGAEVGVLRDLYRASG